MMLIDAHLRVGSRTIMCVLGRPVYAISTTKCSSTTTIKLGVINSCCRSKWTCTSSHPKLTNSTSKTRLYQSMTDTLVRTIYNSLYPTPAISMMSNSISGQPISESSLSSTLPSFPLSITPTNSAMRRTGSRRRWGLDKSLVIFSLLYPF